MKRLIPAKRRTPLFLCAGVLYFAFCQSTSRYPQRTAATRFNTAEGQNALFADHRSCKHEWLVLLWSNTDSSTTPLPARGRSCSTPQTTIRPWARALLFNTTGTQNKPLDRSLFYTTTASQHGQRFSGAL